MNGQVGERLAEGGAIVGGTAALGATLGFIAGTIAHELDETNDPHQWARHLGTSGGLLGLYIWVKDA